MLWALEIQKKSLFTTVIFMNIIKISTIFIKKIVFVMSSLWIPLKYLWYVLPACLRNTGMLGGLRADWLAQCMPCHPMWHSCMCHNYYVIWPSESGRPKFLMGYIGSVVHAMSPHVALVHVHVSQLIWPSESGRPKFLMGYIGSVVHAMSPHVALHVSQLLHNLTLRVW